MVHTSSPFIRNMKKEPHDIKISRRISCTARSSMKKQQNSNSISKSLDRPVMKNNNSINCELPLCNQAQDINRYFVTHENKKSNEEHFVNYYTSCILKGR